MDASCESVWGCQFTSEEYQRFLEAHRVICSMSVLGNCRQCRRRELLLCAETGTGELTARQQPSLGESRYL